MLLFYFSVVNIPFCCRNTFLLSSDQHSPKLMQLNFWNIFNQTRKIDLRGIEHRTKCQTVLHEWILMLLNQPCPERYTTSATFIRPSLVRNRDLYTTMKGTILWSLVTHSPFQVLHLAILMTPWITSGLTVKTSPQDAQRGRE